MKKIKIKTSIISDNTKIKKNLIGNIESGIISYEDTNNSYIYLDINRDELIRENEEIILKYLFKEKEKTIGIIFIKNMKKELEIELLTNKIEKNKNKYFVSYSIDQNKIDYEINYEEVNNELY